MAGSWQHMTTRSGKLRNNESFCGMIGNLGDAYEAAEECYGMVHGWNARAGWWPNPCVTMLAHTRPAQDAWAIAIAMEQS